MRQSKSRLSDQYCVFHVGAAEFAVAAADVREIVETVPIVAVPQSPSWLVGLCHLRNEFLPVLSLLSILGESTVGDTPAAFLLVIDGPEGAWALEISQVVGLDKLEPASTNGTPHETHLRLILGTASFRDSVVRIVDATRVYRAATELLDREWSTADMSAVSSADIPSLLSAHATC